MSGGHDSHDHGHSAPAASTGSSGGLDEMGAKATGGVIAGIGLGIAALLSGIFRR